MKTIITDAVSMLII